MHMDHVGLAARVKEASGAMVLTGRLDAERMAHAAAHPDEEAGYRAALLRRCGAPDEMVRVVEELQRRGAAPRTLDGDVLAVVADELADARPRDDRAQVHR